MLSIHLSLPLFAPHDFTSSSLASNLIIGITPLAIATIELPRMVGLHAVIKIPVPLQLAKSSGPAFHRA